MNYYFFSVFLLSYLLLNKNKYKLSIEKQIEYNNFVDCRTCYNIKNYYNVISNLIFIIGGLYHINSDILLCIFSILVCIGSSYYHYNPNMNTLLYDRLPILLSFVYLILQRIELNIYEQIIISIYAIYSIVKWNITYDLLPYATIQLSLIIYWFIFPSYNMQIPVILYFLAKICEDCDFEIYYLTNKTISGHTIKHIFAGIALFYIS